MSEGYEMYEGIECTIQDLIQEYELRYAQDLGMYDLIKTRGSIEALNRLLEILNE